MTREKELKAKGYRFAKSFNSVTDAKEYAKQLRNYGKYACVVTSKSCVRGYNTYSVFSKVKES